MKKFLFVLVAICIAISAYASCGVGKFKNASGNCEQCPAGLSTFDGADEIEDCGKVLHFGDDFIYLRQNKKTKPSLVVVVDGVEYYGNMTTNNASKLKINMDGTEYSVYDERMTPLEYLYFDGNSYIDLGFPPSTDLNFEIKAWLDDSVTDRDGALLGVRTHNRGCYAMFILWYATLGGRYITADFNYDSTTCSYTRNYPDNNIQLFRLENNIFYINNSIAQFHKGNTLDGKNLLLGTLRSASGPDSRAFLGWVYYAKFWDSNGMIMDLVPVLDPTGVPCMYDKVSGRFLYNQGTGTFGYQISE